MKGKIVYMKFKIGKIYNNAAQSKAFTFISANLKYQLGRRENTSMQT
jgi:hypothetical protein